jgi:hypothetical protein
MSGAIPPFPQYAFMVWCSAKAQGLYLTGTGQEDYSLKDDDDDDDKINDLQQR